MLLPSVRFDLPFTCQNAQGVATAPDSLPVAMLYHNGTAHTTTVTVTMSGAQGIASCLIPATAEAGDRFYLLVTASIGGVSYAVVGPSEAVESMKTLTSAYDAAKLAAPVGAAMTLTSEYNAAKFAAPAGAAMTLTSAERTTLATAIEAELLNDLTGAEFLAGIESRIQALFDSGEDLSVSMIASAVASEVRGNLAEEVAAMILRYPSNKLLTDTDGFVTAAGASSNGSSTTFVLPLRSESLPRILANRIDLFARENVPLVIAIRDDDGQPVDCTGLVGVLSVEGGYQVGGLLPSSSSTGGVADQFQWTPMPGVTDQPGTFRYSLRVADSTQRVLAHGKLVISDVP